MLHRKSLFELHMIVSRACRGEFLYHDIVCHAPLGAERCPHLRETWRQDPPADLPVALIDIPYKLIIGTTGKRDRGIARPVGELEPEDIGFSRNDQTLLSLTLAQVRCFCF